MHEGTFSRRNGDRYRGSIVEGKEEGQGVMVFSDGDAYRGTFRHGLMHGEGCYVRARTGDILMGRWVDGVLLEEDGPASG
ncbi:hypothetical protein EJ06DRAFT_553169 [Medusavirus stheno T3]|uniref:MORN repeat-containing protein n=1 Tax=Medusavirus stheno T3 TaxID=3069717 RepID=A0A7S7YEZ0_9VIRU|nr:hypothetical protein EJ06DRAFT_553169 [Acanthamoeba castellanii medusavirus]QPB44525.1 hypothetical protein EJ06DRAFT_553169 [Medusavirus stheno T3]